MTGMKYELLSLRLVGFLFWLFMVKLCNTNRHQSAWNEKLQWTFLDRQNPCFLSVDVTVCEKKLWKVYLINMRWLLLFQVEIRDFPGLNPWNPKHTLQSVLGVIRDNMASKQNYKLPQPAEGTTFFWWNQRGGFFFFVCVWLSSTLFQAKPFDFVACFWGVENIMGGMPAFYWWQKEPFSLFCEMVSGKSLLVWQEVAAILCQSGQILMQMVTEWGNLGNRCKVLGLYFAK